MIYLTLPLRKLRPLNP